MGEKGNLEPATIAGAAGEGGRSVATVAVDVAGDTGGKLSDAVISQAAGAGVGAAAAKLTDKDDEATDEDGA